MSGPQHYAEAERLLSFAMLDDTYVDTGNAGEATLAAAQVHATLALAAATIEVADITAGAAGVSAGPNTAAWNKAVAS